MLQYKEIYLILGSRNSFDIPYFHPFKSDKMDSTKKHSNHAMCSCLMSLLSTKNRKAERQMSLAINSLPFQS